VTQPKVNLSRINQMNFHTQEITEYKKDSWHHYSPVASSCMENFPESPFMKCNP
jgi:hypothetical protein